MRRILIAAVATAVLSAGTVVAAPMASASPACSGNGCNNGDPEVYGCAGDAETVDTGNGHPGTLELRYSPSCHAAWVRLSNAPVGEVMTIRNSINQFQTWSIQPGYDYGWSNMVGATSGEKVTACGTGVISCLSWTAP